MCNIYQIQLRLGFLIATFGLVVSCLITNCPKGGKRSEITEDSQIRPYAESNLIRCTPCGPGNEGVCIGGGICCGRGIGCHASPEDAKKCRNVRTFQKSCLLELAVPSCGDRGRCRSRYLCCTKEECVPDMSCRSMPPVRYKESSGTSLAARLFHSGQQPGLNELATGFEDDTWITKSDWSLPNPNYES